MTPTEEELIKRNISMNKMKVISNIILIVVFIAIAVYIIVNVEAFKAVGQDVCKLCMQKTGATCIKLKP